MVQPGETLSAKKLEVHCGGKGLNQSIALARAGISVYHAGMVGVDGDDLVKVCQNNKIDTRFVNYSEGKSGHAVIQVNEHGENCILLYSGANGEITFSQVTKVLESFEEGDLILLQNEISEMGAIIDLAYMKKMKIILNPSPFNESLNKCHLEKVSIFVMNEIEGQQITGKHEPTDILNEMKKKFSDAEVILTLGTDGVMYSGEKGRYQNKCYQVKTIDTTAAGDSFLGYYIAGIMSEKTVLEALRQASAAAAIAVTRKGASPSIPQYEEVENFLKIHG